MRIFALLIVLAACADTAGAVVITSAAPSGSRMTAPTIDKKARAAAADDSSGMRQGDMQGLDLGKGTFKVFGQPVNFDPRKVRVIGADGKPASIYQLRPGARVRFTLDPSDPTHRRAGTLFLQ